jgi:HAD superfamily hydrolase (TIGR01509 family)
MYKALIFDMDGLMIDSELFYWRVGREIAGEFGKECPDTVFQSMMGRKPLESMGIFCRELGIDVPAGEMLLRRDGRVAELLKEVEPMPGLLEILKAFHGRLRLAICTSATRDMVDIVMEKLRVEHYFDAVQTSDGVSRGKPDPEIYLAAMGKLGVKGPESIVLEDSCNGAQAGKNAGAYTIAIPSVYTCSQDFSFADFRAKDLHEARERVGELVGK